MAECRAYANAAVTCADTGLAAILGKYSAGVEGIGEVDQAKKDFDKVNDANVLAKTAAAREVINC